MDLKIYYEKVRAEQAKIADAHPVVVSLDTQDGGKAGVTTEVPKAVAAKMIVDGLAKLAPADVARAFRKANADAKQKADELAEAAVTKVKVIKD